MKAKLNVTVQQAAALMGVADLKIRAWLQYGKWRLPSGAPVGEAYTSMRNKKYHSYFISAPKLAEYLGITEENLWERIDALE